MTLARQDYPSTALNLLFENAGIYYQAAVDDRHNPMHAWLAFFHADLDHFGHVRSEASEAGDAAVPSRGQGLVPSCFLRSKLQHAAHAGSVPCRRKVGKILVLGQQMQPVLQWIFPGGQGEFIDEALERKCRLQGVDRPHPAQGHRGFDRHVFQPVVGYGIHRSRLVR